jgi:hypothetical protein
MFQVLGAFHAFIYQPHLTLVTAGVGRAIIIQGDTALSPSYSRCLLITILRLQSSRLTLGPRHVSPHPREAKRHWGGSPRVSGRLSVVKSVQHSGEQRGRESWRDSPPLRGPLQPRSRSGPAAVRHAAGIQMSGRDRTRVLIDAGFDFRPQSLREPRPLRTAGEDDRRIAGVCRGRSSP